MVYPNPLSMQIRPLRPDLEKYLRKYNLDKKFIKQTNLFIDDPHHPSLNTESLQPKSLKIYSFRLDRKYRVVFVFLDTKTIEIVDINNHYQ